MRLLSFPKAWPKGKNTAPLFAGCREMGAVCCECRPSKPTADDGNHLHAGTARRQYATGTAATYRVYWIP